MYHKEQYLTRFYLMCIIDMATRIDNETELIQYAYDTVILTFDTSIDKSKAKLEQNSNKLIQYFHKHELNHVPQNLDS